MAETKNYAASKAFEGNLIGKWLDFKYLQKDTKAKDIRTYLLVTM